MGKLFNEKCPRFCGSDKLVEEISSLLKKMIDTGVTNIMKLYDREKEETRLAWWSEVT